MTPTRNLAAAGLALWLGQAAWTPAWSAEPITGDWRAVAVVAGAEIPFRLALTADGEAASGHFFDGPRPTNPSAEGSYSAGRLHLVFPSYAATLDATIADGHLDGAYATPGRSIPVHAIRATPDATALTAAPSIAGEWIVPFHSEKGETAWRLIVKQSGSAAQAAILRVDGDTGTLDGRFESGAFHLSHFAGERPAALEITPQPDRSLKLVLRDGSGEHDLTAVRQTIAARQGVAPTDPTRQASVRDRAAAFRFAFPDLSGKVVGDNDPRFRGKVVVVDVMGSWCPNCHDEAPFLQTLYEKYRKAGLEVVALDFEQSPDQVADPRRLRAFVGRYGLTYAVLLAGETKDVHALLPQAVGLNAWPTTFFIGRDGHVKATHTGFTSPGSGPRDVETRREVERTVQTLLAQR